MMRNPEQTISKLIDKSATAFLCYIDGEGFPVTRAMLKPRRWKGLRELWFSTNTSSNKVAAFRQNPQASVYFIDRRFFRGVSLAGTAQVLEDHEAKAAIWQTGDRMYYPGGVDDPDYCVIRFTAQKGRYYSKFHSEDFEITGEQED